MARKKDHRGNPLKSIGRFVPLTESMMDTDAWKSLDPFAVRVWIELRKRYNGSNNGGINISVRQLVKFTNTSNKPVLRSLRELEEKGFIKTMVKGSFNWKVRYDEKETHRASIYLLTDLPQDEPIKSLTATHLYKDWKPEPKEENLKKEEDLKK